MHMKTFVINAAGGNATAIRLLNFQLSRALYESFGTRLMSDTAKYAVEQAGFLIRPSADQPNFHFEMSGGEFCGNAARSAALLIASMTGNDINSFTMSGYTGLVISFVENDIVKCEFKSLPTKSFESAVDSTKMKIVDLGGIVHVIVDGKLPDNYTELHRHYTECLNLSDRAAVGVLWCDKTGDNIVMHPVVWVKSIDTFFYETSCGSGSIAVAVVSGVNKIIQPSGQTIKVEINDDSVVLESSMEIMLEKTDSIMYSKITDIQSNYKAEFICLYKAVFGGAPYFEVFEDEYVANQIWKFHIENGLLLLATHNCAVVGFSAAVPLIIEPKVYEFLKNKSLSIDIDGMYYVSELGVSDEFRKSDMRIGVNLSRKLIRAMNQLGIKNYILRTASEGSNSKNLFLNAVGARLLEGVIQDVDVNPDEVDSSSKGRIFLYGETSI